MKRSPLEHVKHLIGKLSPEDRKQIIPFLARFSDSGLQQYDLTEEVEALKKHGTRPPEGNHDDMVVTLVFIRDLVEVLFEDRKIAHARFFPNNFTEAYPAFKNQVAIMSEAFQKTEGPRETRRKNLEAQGIHQTDEELEAEFIESCNDAARMWVEEKGRRIAERISRHFPGMVADMMIAAIKGQTFYDLAEAAKEFGKEIPSSAPIKKAVQDIAWRDLKPHLPSTRHSRTPTDWRSNETLKRYAALVGERHLLTTCIKDKFTECDEAEDWTEDLREDANFQKLSAGIEQEAVNRVIRRTADSGLSDRERRPLALALDMARFELELTELDIETLDDKYGEGNRLLKAERTQRKQT